MSGRLRWVDEADQCKRGRSGRHGVTIGQPETECSRLIDPDFPTLDLTLLPDEPGYISDESIDIILDLTKVGLTSQIEGARQMTTRCGSMLTQSVSLASASIGAACFGLSNASLTGILKPTAILATALTAAGLWTVSAVCCAAGIVGRDFGAPGYRRNRWLQSRSLRLRREDRPSCGQYKRWPEQRPKVSLLQPA